MGAIHIITGEDDYLTGEAAARIAASVPGAAVEVFDSLNDTNAELQLSALKRVNASVSTPPFLEPAKVTWWKNVGFLPQGGAKGPSEDVKKALENFAKRMAAMDLPPNQKLVITGPRLLKTSLFAKNFGDAAEIKIFPALKPWEKQREAVVRTIDMAKESGLSFERGAAEKFIVVVGTDSRSIMSELSKMRDYLGDGRKTITEADIAEITSSGAGVEPALWDVTDALGERNAGKAIEAARRFESESGFAIMMSTVIEKFFRQLALLKDAQERGLWAQATEGMAPFVAEKNRRFLSKWRLLELRKARAGFVALREKAVSSAGSVDALVIAEIARSCSTS